MEIIGKNLKKAFIITTLLLLTTNLFGKIDIEVDRKKASVGDRIIVNIFNDSNENYKILGANDFEIHNSGESNTTQIINGEKIKSIIKNYIFIPKKNGLYTIVVETKNSKESFEIKVEEGEKSTFKITKGMNKTSIKGQTGDQKSKVISLPEKGKPQNFSGIVGEIKGIYSLKDTGIDKVKIGEAITAEIVIEGSGNLEELEKLFEGAEDINIFEEIGAYSKHIEVKTNDFYNKKNFLVAFVPTKAGKIKLPTLKINYFDVETKKYKELKLLGETIEVVGDVLAVQNSPINKGLEKNIKEVKIEKISVASLEALERVRIMKILVIILLVLVVIQQAVLMFMFKEKLKKFRKNITTKQTLNNLLKEMKKSKTTEEYYENFLRILNNQYSFEERVDESKKLPIEIRKIYEVVVRKRFLKDDINWKEIIKELEVML